MVNSALSEMYYGVYLYYYMGERYCMMQIGFALQHEHTTANSIEDRTVLIISMPQWQTHGYCTIAKNSKGFSLEINSNEDAKLLSVGFIGPKQSV